MNYLRMEVSAGDRRERQPPWQITILFLCCCLPMYHNYRNGFIGEIEAFLYSKVHAVLEC